ncbi:MAG: hypothetical protein IJZ88_05285 [Clostridia bacterium]|nr:hypothetical protein [Clostridia bacterium]
MLNTDNSYLDTAIEKRSFEKEIPDVRDGLTPTQRKVLAKVQNATNNGKRKCTATIIADFEGEHLFNDMLPRSAFGISAKLYDTILNMVQEWKAPTLLQGAGNFGRSGSCYGDFSDPHYNEVKLSEFANTIFNVEKQDLDEKSTVFFACLPNVLISGTEGTMCSIPPHNLGEVIDAVIALIRNPDISEDELLSYIKGPDFIEGGIIINKCDLAQTYKTGVGNVVIRGKVDIHKDETGRPHIIINELPFTLMSKFKCVGPHNDIKDIKSIVLDDFPMFYDAIKIENRSSKDSVCIDIALKKRGNVQEAIEALLLHSKIEEVYEYRAILLSDGKPKLMSLYEILNEWLEFYRQKLTEINDASSLNDNQICENLLDIKNRFATPRKTEIINV